MFIVISSHNYFVNFGVKWGNIWIVFRNYSIGCSIIVPKYIFAQNLNAATIIYQRVLSSLKNVKLVGATINYHSIESFSDLS